jgi:hypothetical protein
MGADDHLTVFIDKLRGSWPGWLGDALVRGEIQALREGRPGSLPFFARKTPEVVDWVTLASRHEQLLEAWGVLRAWVVPGLGWEETGRAFAPRAETEPLRSLAPTGYVRWRSRSAEGTVREILDRLSRARGLAAARPSGGVERVPSLLELRQKVAAALAAGDRVAADEAIDLLDRHRLDTASNTLFLRVRVWDRFGEPDEILDAVERNALLALRLPRPVLLAVSRALHAVRIGPHEEPLELDGARAAYVREVSPLVGRAIDGFGPSDGPACRRLRAYRAAESADGAAAQALAVEAEDPVVRAIIGPLLAAPAPRLAVRNPTAPRTWSGFLEALVSGRRAEHDPFLDEHDPFDLSRIGDDERGRVASALEELASRPDASWRDPDHARFREGLASLIGECLENGDASERDSPLLAALASAWLANKKGASYPPDGQLFLGLLEGYLSLRPLAEEPLGLVRSWWQARPGRPLLAFMLVALELFAELGTRHDVEQIWALAFPTLLANWDTLTRGEREAWRRLGEQVQLESIDLPAPQPESADEESDPLREAELDVIAIVSLREDQARTAKALLAARTTAEVRVVSATHGNFETDALRAADVIAYVWSASTHSVFRAFQKADRKKITYVQGTSATAIVLAIERWIARQADPR